MKNPQDTRYSNYAWTGRFVDELLLKDPSSVAWLDATDIELKKMIGVIFGELSTSPEILRHFGNPERPPTAKAIRRWLESLPPGGAYWKRRMDRLMAALHQNDEEIAA
jgi:hypothetical protein